MNVKEEAREMLRDHNPRFYRELEASGKLEEFLTEIECRGEDLFSRTMEAVEKKEGMTPGLDYERAAQIKAMAIAAGITMVRETLIEPLGRQTR